MTGSLSRPIMEALDAVMTARPDGTAETVERLGGGWVAEEALAIAVYAARVGRDAENGLQIAVAHGGGSTGALGSNLLGLLHPAEALAHRWRSDIYEKADACADLSCCS